MLGFLSEIERNRTLTNMAVAPIAETGPIQPWPFSVKVADQMTPFAGLFRIDEPAMNALDEADFLKLRKSGALPLVYMQLLDGSGGRLDQLNRIQQRLTPPRRELSLDEIFATADSGILRSN